MVCSIYDYLVQIRALPLTYGVILSKLINLSLSFHICLKRRGRGIITNLSLRVVVKIKRDKVLRVVNTVLSRLTGHPVQKAPCPG